MGLKTCLWMASDFVVVTSSQKNLRDEQSGLKGTFSYNTEMEIV